MSECATCTPYDPPVSAGPRRVVPCRKCLSAMPTTLRNRWKTAYRNRVNFPAEHAEMVIEVMQWARAGNSC